MPSTPVVLSVEELSQADREISAIRSETDDTKHKALLNEFVRVRQAEAKKISYSLMRRYRGLTENNDIDAVQQLVLEVLFKLAERDFTPYSGLIFNAVWYSKAAVQVQGYARSAPNVPVSGSTGAVARMREVSVITMELTSQLNRTPTNDEILDKYCKLHDIKPGTFTEADVKKYIAGFSFVPEYIDFDYSIIQPRSHMHVEESIDIADTIDNLVAACEREAPALGRLARLWIESEVNGTSWEEEKEKLGMSPFVLRRNIAKLKAIMAAQLAQLRSNEQ